MKDALGHGSNPRGAHAEGVEQVGQQQTRPTRALHPMQNMQLMSRTSRSDALDPDTVEKYRAQIARGEPLPPILIDKNDRVLDGHHRLRAARDEHLKSVPVEVNTSDILPNPFH